MRNRGALPCWVLLTLTSVASPPFVEAQSPTARVQVQLAAPPDSGREAGKPVLLELRSDSDPVQSWPVTVGPTEPVVFRFLPPGRYRLIGEAVDFHFVAASGEQVTLEFAPALQGGGRSTAPEVRTTVSRPGGYGTRLDSTVLGMLPQSGSIWGLIERAILWWSPSPSGRRCVPGVGRAGAGVWCLVDPDVLSPWRGGHQDPDSTGFPLLYPNLDALEAMTVITAVIRRTCSVQAPTHPGSAAPVGHLAAIGAVPAVAATASSR